MLGYRLDPACFFPRASRKHPMSPSFARACRLCGIFVTLVLAGKAAQVRPNPKTVSEQAADLLVERRGLEEISPEFSAKRNSMLSQGPAVIPSLILLFEQSKDDEDRTLLLDWMSMVPGDKSEAVRFVEKQIAQDPSTWMGRNWIMGAFRLLTIAAPEKSRAA